jgi:L-lactate dehydrogenase (cytochrome)
MPVLLAPVGYLRVMHPGGEHLLPPAPPAAGERDSCFLPFSGHKLEDVRTACSGPAWFQLYLTGGRAAAEQALERHKARAMTSSVVTIDTTGTGRRERNYLGMEQLLRVSFGRSLPFFTPPHVRTSPVCAMVRFPSRRDYSTMRYSSTPEKGSLPCESKHYTAWAFCFQWPDMA